jgi:hypothetical protein
MGQRNCEVGIYYLYSAEVGRGKYSDIGQVQAGTSRMLIIVTGRTRELSINVLYQSKCM